ncbi:protein arginine N-methyltransferase 6 [Toxorhynchites rutilus septentrionalis]|uniref:protein arginine N-methyltransferase 6 n=1 Tax=Toxorhynchites rutilus septentrionalis TaxID=329112 RepID=UPI0024793496|nr:protein arginine N-methyltransferase 6 [Toxorhynchites rutilus septentrionalis]
MDSGNLDEINSSYFDSYEDLGIHQLMLTDKPRQDAYRKAILDNKELFKNKVVLDVGTGTGILSVFCAQAGAKKVYAVEASNLARLAREVIAENGFENTIEVFECKIEEFKLPEGTDRVDIIVSEWMGFFLLHEGMLDSVIFARDNFLKPNGLLFPDTATIFVSPCSVPTLFDSFDSLSGVSMKTFGRELRKQKSDKPEILTVAAKDLLHEGLIMAWLDLKEVTVEDLNTFEMKEVMVIQKPGKFQGICIWFDCTFPTCNSDQLTDVVVLSTSPSSPPTHWKQSVILLPENACEEVDKLDPVAFNLNLTRNPEYCRRYNLQLTLLDAEQETHGLPCDCVMTKCILMKAHLQKMEVDQ